MLMYLNPWKPSEDVPSMKGHNGGPSWDFDDEPEPVNALSSYIV
jgi:hypothetical protein